ncbi:MAG: hypothetical protein LBQ47_07385 [Endomicrobium sp.]|jgi:signal transduction histidine kinase|nr:hypothetical protein [Endomicrobium sp.]
MSKTVSEIYRQFYNKRHYFVIAAFSVLLNWAGNTFVYENSYKFLYFDMLGTFVAVIALGSVWGILTALCTAILLSSITSPHFIYLAVVNMMGALYWGILSESGTLAIIKSKNNSFKPSLKSNMVSCLLFILFAGIGCGLFTAVFSSVLRGVVFQDAAFESSLRGIVFQDAVFDRPYSLYFAQLFKQIFGVEGSGWLVLFANYVADTFIEIPDKLLTAFCGISICLTIFKFNIKTLTGAYQDKIQNEEVAWYKIMLKNLGPVEVFLFIVLGAAYLFKIKAISLITLTGFFETLPVNSPQNYIFLEMAVLPLFLILILLAVKFFMPGGNPSDLDLNISVRSNFSIKNMDRDIKYFLTDTFAVSAAIVSVYMIILISITGITPVKYYKLISTVKSSPETLIWLFIMLLMFILIDRKNNRTTEAMTLNEELVKKQTAEHISETFDAQRQKLQIMELSWSDNTVEFLRSARHDLINHLEKSKTGLDELLIEVYDNVVKPYSSSILESQKEMRSYVEEITGGRLSEYPLSYAGEEIDKIIQKLRAQTSSYMDVYFENFENADGKYCKINRLFFTAVNNIIDNSVYALQKLVLNGGFKACVKISLSVLGDKTFCVKISDNAGGLSKENIARIYKFQFESSKGQRLGEGTIIAGNFIKLLGGYITAQNVRQGGAVGLESAVYLPYYEKHGK